MLHSNIESSFFEPLVSAFCSFDFVSVVAPKLFVFVESVRWLDVLAASDVPFKCSFELVAALNSVATLSELLCELFDRVDDDGVDAVAVSTDEDIVISGSVLFFRFFFFLNLNIV